MSSCPRKAIGHGRESLVDGYGVSSFLAKTDPLLMRGVFWALVVRPVNGQGARDQVLKLSNLAAVVTAKAGRGL